MPEGEKEGADSNSLGLVGCALRELGGVCLYNSQAD